MPLMTPAEVVLLESSKERIVRMHKNIWISGIIVIGISVGAFGILGCEKQQSVRPMDDVAKQTAEPVPATVAAQVQVKEQITGLHVTPQPRGVSAFTDRSVGKKGPAQHERDVQKSTRAQLPVPSAQRRSVPSSGKPTSATSGETQPTSALSKDETISVEDLPDCCK